jgi:hypothetical protein
MDRATEQTMSPRIDAIPFDSEHKFMATLHKSTAGKEALFVKGAPEIILEHCNRQQTADGRAASLDRAHFMQASDRLAARDEQVLALAWPENPGVKAGDLGPANLPKTLVLLLQLLFTYAAPFQVIFGNETIPLWVWPWLLAGGLLFFVVVEAEKLIIRRSDALRNASTAVEAGA